VAATDRELIGFVPEARLLEQRRKDAAARPRDLDAQLRFGVALADGGHLEEAQELLQRVEKQGLDKDARVVGERHRVLLSLAEQHARGQQWDKAAARLNEAAAEPFAVGLRLEALVQLAELWDKVGQPAREVAAWQMILADSSLRQGNIACGGSVPRLAARCAGRRIDDLIDAYGPEVYAPYEATARGLLATLDKEPKKAEGLCWRLLEQFPNSAAAQAVLAGNTHLPEAVKDIVVSPHMDRHVLRSSPGQQNRAAALERLARHYEQAQYWHAAAATWKRLAVQSREFDSNASTCGLYCEDREGDRTLAGSREMGLPLTRAWRVPFQLPSRQATEQLLPEWAQGVRSKPPVVYLARDDGSLVCRNVNTGEVGWEADVGQAITWVGRQADLLIAAGPGGVHALELLAGAAPHQLWRFTFDTSSHAGRLSHFQLSASRLFFLEGGERLWALDVETGQPLWNRWAPGARLLPPPDGQFDPHYYAGPERLIVRTTSGQRWVLDARTGQALHQSDGQIEPWPQRPLPLDKHRFCLVPDARHIVLFEPKSGREIWKHAVERVPSLTGEPPQVLGNGSTLLLLVARNHGQELVRLNADTGTPRWTRFLGAGAAVPDLSAAAFDDKAVYLTIDRVLHAFALADGKPLWQMPLGSRPVRWRTLLTKSGILVHATEAQPDVADAVFLRRYLPSSSPALVPTTGLLPVSAGLPGLLTVLRREREPSQIPLVVCDPSDGGVIQRLNFASVGSRAEVGLFEHSGIVVGRLAAWGIK
jgi:outer membrane protein assembly factor BamB